MSPTELAKLYSYSSAWSDDDGAFVARCAEFPSLGTHGWTEQESLDEMLELVSLILEELPPGEIPSPALRLEKENP